MGTIHRIRDNLVNFVTGLGTAKDPTASLQYNLDLINQSVLETAYRSDWLARRIVDAPADDATREWRSWQASNEQIEKIEAVEQKFDIQRKLRLAIIRARLYGGAVMVLGVEQGNSAEELNLEAVGEGDLKFVVVLSRYELNAGQRIFNVMSPYYGRPEYYTVATPMHGFDGNDSSSLASPGLVQIHPSRVIPFVGGELPDWRLSAFGGDWGDSILQTCDEVLKDFGLTVGGIANMVNDAKMDVVKIPDFSKNIATKEYAERLIQRFTLANRAKSSVNSLLLDKEEEWNRVQTTFSGLPNLLSEFMTLVAGAGGIPVSRLMGQAPAKGLGSTSGGEQDMRNYYDTIASQQKTVYTPSMGPLDQIVMRSALGKYDPRIFYEWNSLYQPDPMQVADIAVKKSQVAQSDVSMGLINEDALRRARVNQLIEDGTYPGLEDAVDEFGEAPELPEEPDESFEPGQASPPIAAADSSANVLKIVHFVDYDPDQPRDKFGKWTEVGRAGEGGSRLTVQGKQLPDHIPRIPPAWTDVRVNMDPESNLLVVGRDAKGRQQAIYSVSHSAEQARVKFSRTEELAKKYGTIEQQNERARKSSDPKISQAADATKLIMETGIRPGGDRDTKAAEKAYGATTLEGRHVRVVREGVRLQFVGKKGVRVDVPVEDKSTADMLRSRKDKAGSSGRLFPDLDADILLGHVHSFDGGGFKTKDFRTLVANRTAMVAVAKLNRPSSLSAYKKAVRVVAKVVAEKLGNTPVVALQSYINPAVFAEWRLHAGA